MRVWSKRRGRFSNGENIEGCCCCAAAAAAATAGGADGGGGGGSGALKIKNETSFAGTVDASTSDKDGHVARLGACRRNGEGAAVTRARGIVIFRRACPASITFKCSEVAVKIAAVARGDIQIIVRGNFDLVPFFF